MARFELTSPRAPIKIADPYSYATGRPFRETMLVDPMIKDFNELELALRALHLGGNRIPYKLMQHTFGWQVTGRGGKVIFCQTMRNGVLARPTLFVGGTYTDGVTSALAQFMNVVNAHKPEVVKVVFEDWAIYDVLGVERDYDSFMSRGQVR